ncbi:magnesium and cobalt transporter [Allopseudospirillum japonicum]|uniref:Magnesium and cobalt efflux protein CorC n=1 Tax=Allopseudospirillum japonicum TaxID=64971 RepID=A0A1H6QEW8_9GAMM|nr:transporter associated domain-containing protein [Allopseudospirillum japonicum]SEI40436.1 magnesium and cobalt transporter [Allopseudospirillum japonicum]
MSDERSSSTSSRSWMEKIFTALSGEPRTRNELLEFLRDAEQRLLLDAEAMSIIEGALQITEMQVREIMIPRSQMVVIRDGQTPRDFLPTVIESAHSRFPVIGESTDEVLGILLAKDLLPLILHPDNNSQLQLGKLARPALFVPESKRLNTLLKEFRDTHNHMAIVVDEYGGTAGLVTIEDILEQIVGDIEDEHDVDDEEGDIKPLNQDCFVVKALTPIDDFNQHFNTEFSDDEFDTIGGIVMQAFGHLPRRHEHIRLGQLNFTVLSADNRRIRLLQVCASQEEDTASANDEES